MNAKELRIAVEIAEQACLAIYGIDMLSDDTNPELAQLTKAQIKISQQRFNKKYPFPVPNSAEKCIELAKKIASGEIKKLVVTKYKNQKINAYGSDWDSKQELAYYEHLLSLYSREDIEIQPKCILQEKIYLGKNHPDNLREISYIADFRVGTTFFDVKGMENSTFRIKAKMFKAKYPNLKLVLISWYNKQWLTLDEIAKIKREKKKGIKQ